MVLLIDNYDSFSYNLYQLVGHLTGDIRVVRNDQLTVPEIAALASEYASEEEKAQLESLCDQVERQYTAGINHIKKDIEFHTCIAKCSRNRVVEILIPLINSSVSTFATLTRRQLMKETIETHRAVTNAILKGDSVGARCAMIMHLTYNRQKLLELLEAQEKDLEGRKEGE